MTTGVEVIKKKVVYQNERYQVTVVRMPDMDFDTYGVINIATEVIEAVQPILHQAMQYADQFSRWLEPEQPKTPFDDVKIESKGATNKK